MKKYKCIKSFYVPERDDCGYETGNDIEIKVGTVYELSEFGSTYFGAGVHLDSLDDGSWVEISNETLKKCFEEAKE